MKTTDTSISAVANNKGVEAARADYEAAGMKTVPLNPRDKRITVSGWQDRTFGTADFTRDSNIGIQTGGVSGNLVGGDFDTPTAVRVAEWVMKKP